MASSAPPPPPGVEGSYPAVPPPQIGPLSEEILLGTYYASSAVYEPDIWESLGTMPDYAQSLEFKDVKIGVKGDRSQKKSSSYAVFHLAHPLHTTAPPRIAIVAWRGTKDVADIMADVKCSLTGNFLGGIAGAQFHSGFFERAECVDFASLKQIFDDYDEVILTGHSLGGAIAQIVAIMLLCDSCKQGLNRSVVMKKIKCITFGSPLIGDRVLAKLVEKDNGGRWKDIFWSIVNQSDPVPRMLLMAPSWRGSVGTAVDAGLGYKASLSQGRTEYGYLSPRRALSAASATVTFVPKVLVGGVVNYWSETVMFAPFGNYIFLQANELGHLPNGELAQMMLTANITHLVPHHFLINYGTFLAELVHRAGRDMPVRRDIPRERPVGSQVRGTRKLFENQRFLPIRGWNTKFMDGSAVPTDPAAYTRKSHKAKGWKSHELDKAWEELLPAGYFYEDVHDALKPDKCVARDHEGDTNGWVYAFDFLRFKGGVKGKDTTKCYLRQRELQRVIIGSAAGLGSGGGDDDDDDDEDGASATAEPPAEPAPVIHHHYHHHHGASATAEPPAPPAAPDPPATAPGEAPAPPPPAAAASD